MSIPPTVTALLALALVGCGTTRLSKQFESEALTGTWVTREIRDGGSFFDPTRPLTESKRRYTLQIIDTKGEPTLAGPVVWEETSTSGLGAALMAFSMLGALQNPAPPAPEFEIQQRWDPENLSIHATQLELKAEPPASAESITIHFRSRDRGKLQFRGDTFSIRLFSATQQ